MKKFFLFIREQINESSQSKSDDGSGLSVVGVPALSLSHMTAGVGYISIFLNDATPYQESSLSDGESFEKTSVIVSCEEGGEVNLIESIMNFIASDSNKYIMRFDAVSITSTFSESNLTVKNAVSPKIMSNPIRRSTGEVSYQLDDDFNKVSAVVAGIDFGVPDNLPLVDYNENQLSSFSEGATITSWTNDTGATGGSGYDISLYAGTPSVLISNNGFKSGTKAAYFDATEFFRGMSIDHEGDYTLFMVIGRGTTDFTYLYGDEKAQTYGLASINDPKSNFAIGHYDNTGLYAESESDNTNNGTISYSFPNRSDGADFQSCYVFVIRRDVKNNLYIYNHKGDLVALIQAKSEETDPFIQPSTPGRTDGNLKIQELGSAASNATNSFVGSVVRFGLIPRDIGVNFASKLGRDLYDKYKP